MPITKTIPNVRGNFYGGLPYAIDLHPNFSIEGSTLTIQVINRNGVYAISKNDLSYDKIVSVQIGDVVFNGYLVEYKYTKSVGEKILNLYYEDCSKVLDKTFIGLHKIHGFNPDARIYSNALKKLTSAQVGASRPNFIKNQPKASNVIIVGNEFHPCDKNKDGKIDELDAISQIDWCDPCPTSPPDKYGWVCKGKNDLEIFDVLYNFRELLAKIGINNNEIPSNLNDNFYNTHFGKLRDVLQQWCSDYGLTFYWDYSQTKIEKALKFIDLKVPVTIDSRDIDLCDTTEINEGASIRNNFAKGAVTSYRRPGENKQYGCENTEIYTLNCLRFSDLYNKSKYDDFGLYTKYREVGIGLSYYSSSLRDCFYLFNGYQITSAAQAKKLEFNSANFATPSTAVNQKKILNLLGNMKIYKVIDKQQNGGIFSECEALLGDDSKAFLANYAKKMNRTPDAPPYYFVLAETNDEMWASYFNYENNFAKNFLGRHWIRPTNPVLCSLNVNTFKPSIDAPDANNVAFYSKQLNSVSLDFAAYGFEEGSKLDTFLEAIKDGSNANPESESKQVIEGVSLNLNAKSSFIYMDRPAKWFPNEGDMSDKYQALLDYYTNLSPTAIPADKIPILTMNNIIESLPQQGRAQARNNKNIKLYIFCEAADGGMPLTISKVNNFLEPSEMEPVYTSAQAEDICYVQNTINANSGSTVIGKKGIVSNETAWITFDGFQFMMPCQGTGLINDNDVSHSALDDGNNSPFPGYRVVFNQSVTLPVCIPKIETNLINIPNPPNVGSIDVSVLELSREDIDIFSPRTCVPSSDQLRKIHESVNTKENLIIRNNVENTVEFTQIGLPKSIYNPSVGLSSLSVRANDNGIFSSYVINDRFAQTESAALIRRRAEFGPREKSTLPNASLNFQVPSSNRRPLIGS